MTRSRTRQGALKQKPCRLVQPKKPPQVMKRRAGIDHIRSSPEYQVYLFALDAGLCHPVHEPDPDDLTASKRTWEAMVQSWRKGIRAGASFSLFVMSHL